MIRVVTAEQAGASDAAAIASGTVSFDLMRAAGERAAALIATRHSSRLDRVLVFAGSGNNGGDGYVVAAALASRGHSVRVIAAGAPRTDDARRAAALFGQAAATSDRRDPSLIVDALLGTGATGAPRGEVAEAIATIARHRAAGIPVVSLDIASGIDATTGESAGAVAADWTIAFGTMKRGLLIARGQSGAISVVDIGLGVHGAEIPGAPALVDATWVSSEVPVIPAESHKGIRRRVCIVGGDLGMAGATVLAARGAMRSGVGMVRLAVHEGSVAAVQVGAPEATAVAWASSDDAFADAVGSYAHAVLVGPGLGRGVSSRQMLERVLRVWRGPVVLDADALTLFAGRLDALGGSLAGRPAILTPHASECARLLELTTDEVMRSRFTVPFELARRTGAVVLLKGVPTIIAAPDGAGLVSATGTPVLAAAGSGDVLGGIVLTLLAQTGKALESAACAAWVHGRAGEIATRGRPIRGVTLDEVCAALAQVWRFEAPPEPPILAELPQVGERSRAWVVDA